jgi:hypothetical protein
MADTITHAVCGTCLKTAKQRRRKTVKKHSEGEVAPENIIHHRRGHCGT